MKKTFKILKIIKLIAVALLLFSIILPFKSCTSYHDESEFKHIPENERPPKFFRPDLDHYKPGISIKDLPQKAYYRVTKTTYVIKDFDANEIDSWLLVLCFIWPIFIIGFSKKIQNTKFKVINWGLELILSILAGLYIASDSLGGPEIGAIISFISNLIVLIMWLTEGCLMIHLKKKYKNLTTACTQTGVTLPLHTGW